MDVSPLNLGMIAAYYYINYTTIGKNLLLSLFLCVRRQVPMSNFSAHATKKSSIILYLSVDLDLIDVCFFALYRAVQRVSECQNQTTRLDRDHLICL